MYTIHKTPHHMHNTDMHRMSLPTLCMVGCVGFDGNFFPVLNGTVFAHIFPVSNENEISGAPYPLGPISAPLTPALLTLFVRI
jgi:hypothetical protein